MDKHIKPVLKWAGGKTQLLPVLLEKLPVNFGDYYEPFIGSGALLFSVQPQVAIVNDLNSQLINLYRQLQNNSADLISEIIKLDSITPDKELYFERRAIFNAKIQLNTQDIESAALLVWLNKHCFNGLYRVNAKGLFNVPYNNSKATSIDIDNVLALSEYLSKSNITFMDGDFLLAVQQAKTGDFVYFDPPYLTTFTGYSACGLDTTDQKRLLDVMRVLTKRGVYVLMSNVDTYDIRTAYSDYNICTVPVTHKINRNADDRERTELIITNY